MSVSYNGKSPGRAWYVWQKTKALGATLFDSKTSADAKVGAKLGGLSAGSIAAAAVVSHYLFYVPLVPMIAGLAGLGAAGYYGMKAYRKVRLLQDSTPYRDYIRDREDKWVYRQKNPLTKQIVNTVKLAVLQTGKWLGFGAGAAGLAASVIGGLQAAGVAVLPPALSSGLAGSIVATGAALGLAAPVALYAGLALAVAAVPVGIVAGLIFKNKIREHVARTSQDNPFKVRPAAPAPAASAAPAKPLAPAAANSFSASAAPTATPAATSAPAPRPQAPRAPTAAELERKKLADEAAAARRRARGH